MVHWSWLVAGICLGIWFGFSLAYIVKERDLLMGVLRVVSPEDPHTEYLCFPDIRLIFRDGKYAGWYLPE